MPGAWLRTLSTGPLSSLPSSPSPAAIPATSLKQVIHRKKKTSIMLHYYYCCFTVRVLQALKEYLLRFVLLVLLHRASSPQKEENLPPRVLPTARTTTDEYNIAQHNEINNKMKASEVR